MAGKTKILASSFRVAFNKNLAIELKSVNFVFNFISEVFVLEFLDFIYPSKEKLL